MDLKPQALAKLFEQTARSLYVGPEWMLSPLEWAVLRYSALRGAKTITAEGVAAYLGITSARLHPVLRGLVKGGLLGHRVDSPEDVYAILALGRDRIRQDPVVRLTEALSRFAAEDRAHLADMLEVLHEALQLRDAPGRG